MPRRAPGRVHVESHPEVSSNSIISLPFRHRDRHAPLATVGQQYRRSRTASTHRRGGLGATSIPALSQTFAMSQRPAPSSVINPYQKVTKPPVVTDQSSLASTASSGSSNGSNGSSSGIANPYAKKRDAPSSSAAAASGTRASSPIDLTSSPASSPVSKKRKAERTSSSTDCCGEKGLNKQQQQYKIYCDLDGVLVDFDAGIQRVTGSKPHQLPPYILWSKVASTPDFFENLGWMADGKELWNSIKGMDPDILTGVPTAKKCRAQKAAWCERELGMPTSHVDMAGTKKAHEVVSGRRSKKEGVVNVITCWSRNKHCESRRGAVLIDDRLSLQQDWVARGGIFIHHTNTRKSLGELRRLGILPSI